MRLGALRRDPEHVGEESLVAGPDGVADDRPHREQKHRRGENRESASRAPSAVRRTTERRRRSTRPRSGRSPPTAGTRASRRRWFPSERAGSSPAAPPRARNRNPSAGIDRSRSPRIDAIARAASSAGAAHASGFSRVSGRIDQADSSEESRSGSTSRPSIRRKIAQAFTARSSGGSGASGFSSSKMPVLSRLERAAEHRRTRPEDGSEHETPRRRRTRSPRVNGRREASRRALRSPRPGQQEEEQSRRDRRALLDEDRGPVQEEGQRESPPAPPAVRETAGASSRQPRTSVAASVSPRPTMLVTAST